MDFLVAGVRVVAAARLEATTSEPGDAVDPVDPRDCLAPAAWALALGAGAPAGAALPRVRHVAPAQSDTLAPTVFLLDLDAPLTPGAPYALALAALARSAYGQPTSTDALAFAGRPVAGIVGQRAGELAGDVAIPVRADASGDLGLLDRAAALRARVLLLVSARRGSFAHAETFGRGVEPKRSYSVAKLGSEAAALRAELLKDPDVRAAEVRASSSAHVASFQIAVTPVFSPEPLRFNEPIEAGGST